MKKIFLTLFAITAFVGAAFSQAYCPGLKNPTNFTPVPGPANVSWIGYEGHKPCNISTISNGAFVEGVDCPREVQASALETFNNTGGCGITLESGMNTRNTSRDIHNNLDHSRQFVIKGSGTDPETHGRLSYQPPDTSYHSSIRLGNYCGNDYSGNAYGGEKLVYEFTVDYNNALVTLWFAMSLQNGQHSANQNPEFTVRVEKQNPFTGAWSLAMGDTLCYTRTTPASSASTLSGADTVFRVGSSGGWTGATYSCNLYLPWRKVLINLFDLLEQRVRIIMTAGDCCQSAHYALGYIAGTCEPMVLSTNGCAAGDNENVALVRAPQGARKYRWFRSKTGGILQGAASKDTNNYVYIPSATNDSLKVMLEHFIDRTTNPQQPDTLTQTTVLCIMETRMNDTKPVRSTLVAKIGNTKPQLIVDSVFGCNGDITLYDVSKTPYMEQETDNVDTSSTVWKFYSTNGQFLDSIVGGSAYYQFPQGGNYSVKVRTSAYNSDCWNEKTVQIHTVKKPRPIFDVANYRVFRNDTIGLCEGDTLTLKDMTVGSNFHSWTYTNADTTFSDTTTTPIARQRFDKTTRVTMRTRSASYFMSDTTNDGVPERTYCYSDTSFWVYVSKYPELNVLGDTIVCNGEQSDVTVESDVNNTKFDWYHHYNAGTPFIENNNHMVTPMTEDHKYYVKATTPFGCVSWDSISLTLVKPSLRVDKDKICEGDSVTFVTGHAAYFTWTSSPEDYNIAQQTTDSVIVVHPTETTTYKVVGHGTNDCNANALKQTITVLHYPTFNFMVTPGYIDSENPSVQFSDQSINATTSLWNFGNGETSTVRTVVHTFTDLSQDSIEIGLTSSTAAVPGHPNGCAVDTTFFIPVGLFAVWFPNAFTPSLETNNYFAPFTANDLLDYNLYIYDRAGVQVFHSNQVEKGWNGTYKGHNCKQGTYVYIVSYRREGVERLISQKGTVTLLR